MSEEFLHGLEVLELSRGTRPITQLSSSVIGVVGTAPNSSPATKSNLIFETLKTEAKTAGENGNSLSISIEKAKTNSAPLSMVVIEDKQINITLATTASGIISTTYAQLSTAMNAHRDVSKLVSASIVGNGSTKVSTLFETKLQGGSDESFPLNDAVFVNSSRKASMTGKEGTLRDGFTGIFASGKTSVIAVKVAEGSTEALTLQNVINGLDKLIEASSKFGLSPRIVIAPHYSDKPSVASAMLRVATQLKGIAVLDNNASDVSDVIAFRKQFGSARGYIVYPNVIVMQDGVKTSKPASSYVAGLLASTDHREGFWVSPSNKELSGVIGLDHNIDFALGDTSSLANVLNKNDINTIINVNGFRLWGNHTTSGDPRWKYVSVRRIADMINQSIMYAHMWAIDKNIGATFVADLVEEVNAYIRHIKTLGAIVDGKCWADPELNTPDQISQGKIYIDFDFAPSYPAEHIIFRSVINNDYLTEIF